MNTRSTIRSFIFVLTMLLTAGGWTNSTPMHSRGIAGAQNIPIHSNEIWMVREKIEIDCQWETYSVQVDCVFKNTVNHDVDVQFGFPIEYNRYDEDDPYKLPDARNSIRLYWNHQPVHYHLSEMQAKAMDDGDHAIEWVLWTIHFEPNEEATQRIRYTFPLWYYYPGSQKGQPYSYLKYILRTGAAWSAPIESSIITIHYGHPIPYLDIELDQGVIPPAGHLKLAPEGYRIDRKKHTVTWEFKHFIPQHDFFFGWGDVPDQKFLDRYEPLLLQDQPTTHPQPQDDRNTSPDRSGSK